MKKITYGLEKFLELGGTKKEIIFLVISGAALLLSIFNVHFLPFDAAWITIVLCGAPIILEAFIGLVTVFDIKADVLVSIALIASVCTGEYFAAGEVALIMQIGSLLEELTVSKARAGIEKLVNLTPQQATLIVDGEEKIVNANEVKVGDIIRVKPGETIPVDGVIIKGQTSVNQSVMTGESMPVDKCEGDQVSSGTMNQFGSFDMRAEKVGEDSSVQRMIRLVKSADASKAKIVGIADRWATWIVVIALCAAALTWIISGELLRAVTILVVFCPCALVLATPTAIMAATGNAAKHGFLVRRGDALERFAKVNKITFDKTGTLTYGVPKVVNVESCNKKYSADELYILAASVEKLSEHPLGKAVIRYKKVDFKEVFDFKMIIGKGVTGSVDGKKIAAGNIALVTENGAEISDNFKRKADEYVRRGNMVVYVCTDGEFCGIIALSDTVREDSADTIGKIKEIGVTPVLLTGDSQQTANAIGGSLGIEEIHFGCLPEDKLGIIKNYKENKDFVCMIGDGINDAPALKTADVGVAMGGVGSDIAVDAADIVLVDDNIKELPGMLRLARRMMKTIKINLSFSMILNFAAIILAITGILNPVVGALVHNAGSALVIINSAFLMKNSKK